MMMPWRGNGDTAMVNLAAGTSGPFGVTRTEEVTLNEVSGPEKE